MNVLYVHVVSTCQGLLQHINPYLIYPLLYVHLSHVKDIRLVATTLNPIIFSVLDFRYLKRHRSWSGPGSTHNIRVIFGHGPNDTITTSSMKQSLLEKLTGSQLVKKFPALYRNRIFITAFTRAATCPKSEAIVNVS